MVTGFKFLQITLLHSLYGSLISANVDAHEPRTGRVGSMRLLGTELSVVVSHRLCPRREALEEIRDGKQRIGLARPGQVNDRHATRAVVKREKDVIASPACVRRLRRACRGAHGPASARGAAPALVPAHRPRTRALTTRLRRSWFPVPCT
jgi:hypothetical protein